MLEYPYKRFVTATLILALMTGVCSTISGHELRLKIQRNFKWGFINRQGEIVVQPIYEKARDFHKGLAAVQINDRWGYIDVYGDFVMEPVCEKVDDFRYSLARVTINGKTGLVDSTGSYVIEPKYDRIGYYGDDNPMEVQLQGRSGLVNKNGELIVEPQFDGISYASKFGAVIRVGERRNRKCGFIGPNGRITIPPKFTDIHFEPRKISEGYIPIGLGEGRFNDTTGGLTIDWKWTFIDSTGEVAFDSFFEGTGAFGEGFAPVKLPRKFLFLNLKSKYGYIDKTAKTVIKPRFDYAGTFTGQFAIASENEKYGLINRDGKFILRPKYELFHDFRNGIARVRFEGYWGLIDTTGTEIVKPIYESITPLTDRLYRIYLHDRVGLLDISGCVLVEPQFDAIHSFENGLAAIKVNDMWGFIDSTGSLLGELRFLKMPPSIAGLATIVKGNKVGLKNLTGHIVFSPEFDRTWDTSNEIIALEKDGSVGYADSSGNWLWHPWQHDADSVKLSPVELIEKLDTIDSVYDPVVAKIGSLGKKVIPQVLEKLRLQDSPAALRAAWVLRHMADEVVISKLVDFHTKHQPARGLTAIRLCVDARRDLCTSLEKVDAPLLESVLGHNHETKGKSPLLLYGGNLPSGISLSIPNRKINIVRPKELQDIADRKGQIEYTKFDKAYVFQIPHKYRVTNNGDTVEAVAVVSVSGLYKLSRKSKSVLMAGGGSTSIWFKINGKWIFQGITSSWIS